MYADEVSTATIFANSLWTAWTVRTIYRFLDFQHRCNRATAPGAATAGRDKAVAARFGSP